MQILKIVDDSIISLQGKEINLLDENISLLKKIIKSKDEEIKFLEKRGNIVVRDHKLKSKDKVLCICNSMVKAERIQAALRFMDKNLKKKGS